MIGWKMEDEALEKQKTQGWTDTSVELMHAPMSDVIEYYCVKLITSDTHLEVAYLELQGDAEAFEMDVRERMGFEQRPNLERRLYVEEFIGDDGGPKTFPLFLGGGSMAVCEVGKLEDARHIAVLWNDARSANLSAMIKVVEGNDERDTQSVFDHTGLHSPLPWTYHRRGDGIIGHRDWIEDAHGSMILENVGHLDGPLLVTAVNALTPIKSVVTVAWDSSGPVVPDDSISPPPEDAWDAPASLGPDPRLHTILEGDKNLPQDSIGSSPDESLLADSISELTTKLAGAALALEKIKAMTVLDILHPNEVIELRRIATEGAEKCDVHEH